MNENVWLGPFGLKLEGNAEPHPVEQFEHGAVGGAAKFGLGVMYRTIDTSPLLVVTEEKPVLR